MEDEVQRAVRLYNAAMAHRDRLSSLNHYDKEEAIERYKTTMRSNWESGQLSKKAIFGAVHTGSAIRWVPMRMKTDLNALTVADFQLESTIDATQCCSMDKLSKQNVLHHPTLGPIPAFEDFTVVRPKSELERSVMQAMVLGSQATNATEYSWNARTSNYVARPSSAWLVRANWERLSTLNAGAHTPLPTESMDAKSLVPMMMPSDQVVMLAARANALGAKLASMKAATGRGSQGGESMEK